MPAKFVHYSFIIVGQYWESLCVSYFSSVSNLDGKGKFANDTIDLFYNYHGIAKTQIKTF